MAKRIIFLSTLIMAITFFGSCAHRHGEGCAHSDAACASCKDSAGAGTPTCPACKDAAKTEKHDCAGCKDSK